IHQTILNWKNNAEILAEFLKSDEEMEIENNNNFNSLDDNTIYTSKFVNYIDRKSTNTSEIASKKLCFDIE
ncbi:5384_t:CDS:1, partial [Dentiscutata heterogama]